MTKVFIDVGGYHGESARAALDPRFGFDKVFCFEPVRSCYDHIVSHLADPRLTVINAGLLNRTGSLPIYHAGSVGGSIFADAPDTGGDATPELCSFLQATEFFEENIADGSHVWMKLNCEGAECSILLDVISSGQSEKLAEVLIDLDANKIPSAGGSLNELKTALHSVQFSYHFPEEVQYSMVTNFGGIRNWLLVTGAASRTASAFVKSLFYQARCASDPTINGYYKIRLLRLLRLRSPALVPTKAGALVRPAAGGRSYAA